MIRYAFALATILSSCFVASADYYFVYSGDAASVREYLPTKVIRLVEPEDPTKKPALQEVAEIDTSGVINCWQKVRAIPEHGIVLIANFLPEGTFEKITVLPMGSPSKPFSFAIPDCVYMVGYRSIKHQSEGLLLEVRFVEVKVVKGEKTYPRSSHVYSISGKGIAASVANDAKAIPPGSSNLIGEDAFYQLVQISSERLFEPADEFTTIDLPKEPIPHEITIAPSVRWGVVANETEYIAFISSGRKQKGQESKQLLIKSRSDGAWNAYEINGADTRLRVLGEWLVGMREEVSPETDPERHYRMPSTRTGNVIMIHPATKRHLTVPIGDDGQLLLIDGATVTYRKGTQLFRATIGDTDFTDAQMLIDDPRVRYLQCAFKGPDKPE